MQINGIYYTLLQKRPDMHYVKHKLVKNTRPSHHVKHDDTRVPYPIVGEPRSKQ
jgi:hypothetical protein